MDMDFQILCIQKDSTNNILLATITCQLFQVDSGGDLKMHTASGWGIRVGQVLPSYNIKVSK